MKSVASTWTRVFGSLRPPRTADCESGARVQVLEVPYVSGRFAEMFANESASTLHQQRHVSIRLNVIRRDSGVRDMVDKLTNPSWLTNMSTPHIFHLVKNGSRVQWAKRGLRFDKTWVFC